MFATVMKSSESARKAWITRQRNKAAAKPEPVPVVSTPTYKPSALGTDIKVQLIAPTKANAKTRAKMKEYMDGFSTKLKHPQEKAYVQERISQMLSGTARPSGMSGKHGIEKQRAIQYEALIMKIWKAGKVKHNV